MPAILNTTSAAIVVPTEKKGSFILKSNQLISLKQRELDYILENYPDINGQIRVIEYQTEDKILEAEKEVKSKKKIKNDNEPELENKKNNN